MSQTNPPSTPKKTSIRWLWVVLATVCCLPLVAFVVLVVAYLSRSQAVRYEQAARDNRYFAQLQAQHAEATRVLAPIPAVSQSQAITKQLPHVVRIELRFQDFATRFANAIVVDQDAAGSRVMAASDVFAPITGKVNGRLVTREPSSFHLLEVEGQPPTGGMSAMGGTPAMPGVGGPMMGPSSYGASIRAQTTRDLTAIGLTELRLDNVHLDPIRVLGDFAKASIGDKVIVVSRPMGSNVSNELTVLGTDEAVQIASGQRLDHLLKLTAWNGESGALLCDHQGDPVGQIVATTAGNNQPKLSYAVPMERIFQAFYGQEQEGPSLSPFSFDSAVGKTQGLTESPRNDLEPTTALEPIPAQSPVVPNSEHPSPAVNSDGALIPQLNDPSIPPTIVDGPLSKDPGVSDAPNPNAARQTAMRVYRVHGDATHAAETVRSLYGDVAKIAADRAGKSVIVIAAAAVQEEVSVTIQEMNTRAKELEDDRARRAEIQNKQSGFETNVISPAADEPTGQPGAGGAVKAQESFNKNQWNASIGLTDSTMTANSSDAELDRTAKKLAMQLRTAAAEEKPALRQKLEQITEQQFLLRQKLRKEEIDELGGRVDKLRFGQQRREQNKDEIIRRRINQLLDPNSDLRWEEAANAALGPTTLPVAVEITGATDQAAAPGVQKTFDGIAYTVWLKMLETERKPGKLSAAMEACSRLAGAADTHRIAKESIQIASLFANTDGTDQDEVWGAANAALLRLPADVVVDELLASLGSRETANRQRSFQGRFILNADTVFQRALKARDREVIAGLVKAIQTNGDDRNCLLAAACSIWKNSEHHLQDFDGLQPLVMQRIDGAAEAKSHPDADWYAVARALVEKSPETPDLALKLMKLAKTSAREDHFIQMTNLVGPLGRYAEPAVPLIIEQILAELKRLEERENDKVSGRQGSDASNRDQSRRATYLVRLLGDIGVGDKAGTLLKELNLVASQPAPSDEMREFIGQARSAIVHFADIPDLDTPPMLGDVLLARGIWRVKSVNAQAQPEFAACIGQNEFYWGHQKGDRFDYLSQMIGIHDTGKRLKLDPTKSPKEAVFEMDNDSERKGIYELTESTFKIYVAPPQQPRPTEMIKDSSSVPEGYLLIELQRSLSMPTQR